MGLQKHEMETAINWDEEDKTAKFYTCSRKWITKLDKLCKKYPDTYKVIREIKIEGRTVSKEYIFDSHLVSVRTPSTRIISEEQKQAARERLNKMRNKVDKYNKENND